MTRDRKTANLLDLEQMCNEWVNRPTKAWIYTVAALSNLAWMLGEKLITWAVTHVVG